MASDIMGTIDLDGGSKVMIWPKESSIGVIITVVNEQGIPYAGFNLDDAEAQAISIGVGSMRLISESLFCKAGGKRRGKYGVKAVQRKYREIVTFFRGDE